MPKDSPILVRIFKEESELEVWKQDTTGQFELLKVYPICRWSGELGPKINEGDRQAPEGFYAITPGLMNPNSNYYLAINIGFPNAYDKANDYSGAFLMIHGDCSSRGCYAMTDEQIGEIYSLARESFLGGQKEFQIQAYPFRMTPANLARHRNNPNMPFWKMIKEGNDHFEVTHLEPKVDVCDRHYVFDAAAAGEFDQAAGLQSDRPLPGLSRFRRRSPGRRWRKQRNDEYQIAQLIKENVPVAPIVMGTDGGMNRVFVAKLAEHRAGLRQRRAAARAADPSRHAAADAERRRAKIRSDGCRADAGGQARRPVCSAACSTRKIDQRSRPAAARRACRRRRQPPTPECAGHSSFFGSLFKPKTSRTAPPAEHPRRRPGRLESDPRGTEPPKTEAAQSEPQRAEPQIAKRRSRRPNRSTPSQQDASARRPRVTAARDQGRAARGAGRLVRRPLGGLQ